MRFGKHRKAAAVDGGVRTYGFDGTIHQTTQLDVETDKDGNVVAVWFRCQPLPFRQSKTRPERAEDMRRMYSAGNMPTLLAVEVKDN